MRSLLCLALLVVLSVRNDAQLLKHFNLPKNIPLADPSLNIPAPIEPLIDVDEFVITLDSEEPTLGQNGADPNLPAPIDLLIDTDEKEDIKRASLSRLSVGSIGSGDSSSYRTFFNRGPIAGRVQIVNVTVSGTSAVKITAIRVTEQGTSQNAAATLTSGGVGADTASIRMTSASGSGFNLLVQVWAQRR